MKQSRILNLKVSTQLLVSSLFDERTPHIVEEKVKRPSRVKEIGSFVFSFILILIIMAALGGAGLWIKNKINILEKEKLELQVSNEQLLAENVVLIQTNERNVLTISQLLSDKKRGDQIVVQLKGQLKEDGATLTNLRKRLRQIVKNDPTQDGAVSPVLRQAIEEIQLKRYPKSGDKK